MEKLKLGIIGLSEGNGHPYSWSAIFNGYDDTMKDCPFPAIPNYLEKQNFPEDSIPDADVTHIWTQEKEISANVAGAANIPNIVEDPSDLIGKVDGILLARDDHEMHFELSAPFIEAGLPIYIDKPITTNEDELTRLLDLQKYKGQIFSSSSLRYAREFQLNKEQIESMGTLKYVDATVMNSWDKYGVHVIDPVLNLIGDQGDIVRMVKEEAGDVKTISVLWRSDLITTFTSLGKTSCPISIRLFGNSGFEELVFADSYFAFKAALQEFVDIILKRKQNPTEESVYNIVRIIQGGISPSN